MALSSGDATKIRSPHHSWGDNLLVINAVPLTIGATALINQSSFSYPISQLTVNTTSADWLTEGLRGRMVLVGTAPGLYDVTVGVLREDVTATVVKIDAKQAGEPGWPRDIQQALADNYYVSIVRFRPPWGLMSSIRKGVFYKNWDDTYSDQGKNPRPLVNLGEHQQAWVTPSTGLARFTVPADVTYWAGRSYSTHSWSAPTATVISSSASSLTVDCAAGCHEVSYSVTDSKGKVTIAYRYLFANDPTDYPPLNRQYPINVSSTQDRQGCELTLDVGGPVEADTFYPGQLFLLTETPQWGSYTAADLSDPDAVVDSWVGYAGEAEVSIGRGQRTASIRLQSPVKLAQYVPIEKQYIEERTSPGNWAQVTSLLSNPVGVFYYLADHHAPYLIRGHDFDYDSYITTLRRKSFDLNAGVTLGEQLQQLATLLEGVGNIGSKANGTTRMLRNPNYFSNDSRNALSNQWAWAAGDISGELNRSLRYRPQVGKTYAGAFAYGGGSNLRAYRSLAPGYVRSQAGGETSLDDTTVLTSGGQDRVNELAGFHHAQQNPKSAPFSFTVNGNMDVCEPCDLDRWHPFTLAASYDPLGEGWSNARCLPLTVSRQWGGPGDVRKQITVEMEPETFGYPGVTVEINPGAASTWITTPLPLYFQPYTPKAPDLGIDLAALTAWNDVGLYPISWDFGTSQTHWNYTQSGVVSAAVNKYSDYFTIGVTETLEFGVLTYSPTAGALYLYSLAVDVPNQSWEYTLLNTWGLVDTGASFRGFAHIVISGETADFWLMCYKNIDGTFVDRSTDGGATWAGAAIVGSATDDSASINDPLGVAVYNERQVIVAKDGTTDGDGNFIYSVYTASTKTGSFSQVTNPSGWQVVQGALALRNTTSALVPLMKPEAPTPTETLAAVDFDGGYGQYAVTGGLSSSGTGTNAFQPSQVNMAYGSTSGGAGQSCTCTVTVDLTAYYQFSEVTFWKWISNGVTGTSGRSWYYIVTLLDSNDDVIRTYRVENSTTYGAGEITVTAAQLNMQPDDQTVKVRISVSETWASDTGGGTCLVYVDDIDISAELVEYNTQRSVYSLNPSTGTYTQRDSLQKLPFHPYGMAVDSNDSDNVTMIAADEYGNQPVLLDSSDGGATWAKVRSVPGLVGLRRNDTTAILFGYSRLEVSADAGETSYTQFGDWAARVGMLGKINGVTGVL